MSEQSRRVRSNSLNWLQGERRKLFFEDTDNVVKSSEILSESKKKVLSLIEIGQSTNELLGSS